MAGFLDTRTAAAYLCFRGPAGIRECVRRGELVPDGTGPRGTHLFRAENLDAWANARSEAKLVDHKKAKRRPMVRARSRSRRAK